MRHRLPWQSEEGAFTVLAFLPELEVVVYDRVVPFWSEGRVMSAIDPTYGQVAESQKRLAIRCDAHARPVVDQWPVIDRICPEQRP